MAMQRTVRPVIQIANWPPARPHVPPALSYCHEVHAKEFARAASNSKSIHRSWVHPPRTEKEAIALARNRKGPSDYGYVIRDFDSGEIAGFIEITNIVRGAFQSGYLGYYMFKGFERRGYMKWVLEKLIKKKAWGELKLHRLEANIQVGNTASIELVKSLGFHQKVYSPRYLKICGRWRDHERWAILRG
jgi:[ribosomal protein S5]-alanine N-acetyltransferase